MFSSGGFTGGRVLFLSRIGTSLIYILLQSLSVEEDHGGDHEKNVNELG